METRPRVDILIPTYNRCKSLARSIDSARSQTYKNISILVSDNGSSDCTGQYLSGLGVRYVSHPVNRGAHANFNFLWSSSRANLRLFLADDDWIDEDYVSECVDYALQYSCSQVAGQAIHYINERAIGKDNSFELRDQSPLKRLRSFCNLTTSNGLFYGVRNKSNYFYAISSVSDLADTYSSILNGKSAVIPSTNIHRNFSNWHGEALAASSENLCREIILDKQPINLNNVMLFVGVASIIQVYLRADWSLSCLSATIACNERVCLDAIFVVECLKTTRDPCVIMQQFKLEQGCSDLQFATGWFRALHELLFLAPELPDTFLVSPIELSRFLGISRVQVIDICTLWSELLSSPSKAKTLMLRNLYSAYAQAS